MTTTSDEMRPHVNSIDRPLTGIRHFLDAIALISETMEEPAASAVNVIVQAVAHPTDARLMHRAITKLVGFAKRNRVPLRQSYLRLAKRAAIMVGPYTHAHQFKRARRQLKFLRTRLGRIIRDIRRKIDGDAALEARFGPLLDLAQRVRTQDQRPQGLCVTCAGGRVHRQGESPCALRVRLQGQYRHPRNVPEGRTVRAPCQGAARQSLRRTHARPRGRRHGSPAWRLAASMSTKGIAATTTRTGSGS
jgi:hypothetical protein